MLLYGDINYKIDCRELQRIKDIKEQQVEEGGKSGGWNKNERSKFN